MAPNSLNYLLLFVLILLILSLSVGSGSFARPIAGSDYYVDATLGNDNNSGSIDQPWQSIAKVTGETFSPGDHIHFKRGETWTGDSLFIDDVGSAAAPIVFDAYGEGAEPHILNAGISVSGAAYVIIRDFEVSGHGYAGIGVQQQSHHITLTRNVLNHNVAGIWMGNDVGMNNVVFDNEIYLNNGNGVAVDTVFCTPGNETIIAANRIYSNTWHGIELSGNYHIVEQNVVYANGENPDGSDDMVGHSGIHLFSRYHENDPDLGGDYNIIRYNLLYDNRDNEPNATDGNGIQMDMWCDDNQVYNNIAYDNDGPGVIIFGGSRNLIYNNTLFDNGRHLGWRRARTQLMVADSDEVGAAMNKIYNNIGFSQDAAAYAAYIDAGARARNNIFSHNLWHNATGGNLLGLGDNGSVSLTTWNAESWAHDFSGDPQFVDAVSHDFQLRFGSPAIDAADPAYAPDDDFITASRPQGAVPDIGAYEYQYHQVSMPVITISALNSTDVRLTWEHNDHCARYEFWRDASPYFSPSGDAIQTSYDASQSWDDAGVLGDAGVNHYYIARCIHYNQALTNSNRTGEFDFALVRALN